MIRILYFGVLKEQLGCKEEMLDWSGSSSALLALLRARDPRWAEALAPARVFRLVVNQQIVQGETMIPSGTEVGILPPVSGG